MPPTFPWPAVRTGLAPSRVVQGKFLGLPRGTVARGTPPRTGGPDPRALTLAALPPAGRGQSLPPAVQAKMEGLFRTSFAAVRVHVGHGASQLGALAFTCGEQIFFAPGQYQPQSPQGLRLLGHELTHVVQQRSGRARNPLGSGLAVLQDPALEAEAERMACQAAAVRLPPPVAAPPLARPAPRWPAPRWPAPSAAAPASRARSAQAHPAPARRVPPRRPSGVIQRLVYLISDDSLTKGSYRNLTQLLPGHTDPTESLRALDLSQEGLPFDQLGNLESLHLIVHGGGGTVDGMDPDEFVVYLMRRGLRSDQHQGTIRLISCYSATPTSTLAGSSFVVEFAAALRRRGFSNPVIGFDGLVRAGKGGQILVIPPSQSGQFWKLSGMKSLLEGQWEQLKGEKPGPTADDIERELYLLEVAEWKRKFDLVVKKLEALWVPQRLGVNLVHIAEAKQYSTEGLLKPDLYTRRQEAKRWHERQQEYMVGMGLIKPGESARPLRDYSSSYIS
ncbi:MAG TPA: DUF4157 domain-containing protein [Thermoanaerobaculia bacterium]|nr:DUF4157 domain-containing protein [Thermoanaerobaculia bacterium]